MKNRRKRMLAAAGIAAVAALVASALIVVPALATPPSGVTITPLAPVGQFGEINEHAMTGRWMAKIKTKGVSDFHVNQVTIQSGGTLGWHYHPGPSFVIVKSGTATFYMGDDPTCTPHVIQHGAHRPERRRCPLGECRGPARSHRCAEAYQRAEPRQLPLLNG
jgi:hypothetical protein